MNAGGMGRGMLTVYHIDGLQVKGLKPYQNKPLKGRHKPI